MRRRCLFFCLASFVFVLPLRAADDEWPVPRGPSREPVPYRYDAKAWKQVPKEFLEDSPAVTLFTSTTYFVEKDGTVEATTHEITRLNGRKGIEALGEYRNIYFDPAYQKLTLNEARVLKADGTVVAIEPKHVQLRDVATDFQVYDQDKQLVISFPNLEVGDVYDVKWTVRGKNPEFAGQFFTRYTFGDDANPVCRDELHVIVHADKALKHATINGTAELKVQDHKEGKYYAWRVTNRPELPRDDDKPSKEELRLQVACSTFANWEEVARWKQKLRAECWNCAPEVRKTVEDVTRDLKTPLEKARALTYWVRQHIRYLSRGPAGAGYTPHLPHQVLANLFGDCKDQSQLLAVMLKEAGLKPYLVTLGTLDDGQVVEEVPSPWGTHAILMAPIEGKDYWIDTTISQAPWSYLPRTDRDRVAYLTRADELKVVRTPPLTFDDNKIEQTTLVSIGADGSSINHRAAFYHGGVARARREAWLEVPPGERRRLMTAELQDANTRSKLLALRIDDKSLVEFDHPVRAQMAFRIARHFTGDSSRDGSVTDSVVWGRLLAYSLDPDRKVALQVGSPFESLHTYIFQLPPAFRFDAAPKGQSVVSKWGFFKVEVTPPDERHPRRLEVVMHTRLEKARIDPADFADYAKFHEEVNKAYRVWISFAPTANAKDADLLEFLFAVAPSGDPITPRTLGQLYIDAGKWADARRVLSAACAWHPREAELWDLRVKAAATIAEEEDIYRDMIRLFPDEPKHVLALGTTRTLRKDYEGARGILTPLTENASGVIRAAAHYQLAHGYFEQKNFAEALKHMLAGLDADPGLQSQTGVHVFQARLHESLKRTDDAIRAYKDALELSRDSQEILVPLIRLELAAKKTEDALDHLRRYTLVVGKNISGLTQAGELHLEMGRLDDAFELASRARDQGFAAPTQRLLGLIHWRKEGYAKAVFHLDRADADAQVLEGLIRCHIALGDLPAAERSATATQTMADIPAALRQASDVVKSLVQRRDHLVTESAFPADKKVAFLKAVNRLVCAEWTRIEKLPSEHVAALLSQAFPDGVEIGPAFALRGLLSLEKGKLQQALADAEKAAQLKPVEARAFLVRGRVRLERGENAAALNDLTRAAALTGNRDGEYVHWLAAALFRTGSRDDAVRLQREAVRLAPGNAEIAEQLREFQKSAEAKKVSGAPG